MGGRGRSADEWLACAINARAGGAGKAARRPAAALNRRLRPKPRGGPANYRLLESPFGSTILSFLTDFPVSVDRYAADAPVVTAIPSSASGLIDTSTFLPIRTAFSRRRHLSSGERRCGVALLVALGEATPDGE